MCDTPEQSQSERLLIEALQRGELDAFDALFSRYRARILAYLTNMLRDRGLAEDITQDCFVALVRRVDRIKPERGVGPWLFRVARNRAIDVMRKRGREVLDADKALWRADSMRLDEGSPADALVLDEEARQVRAGLAKVPAKYREVLVLHYFGDLKFSEVARVLHRPLGTVLWQARRALKELSKHVET